MKYVTEYRDAGLTRRVLDEIRHTVTRPSVLMADVRHRPPRPRSASAARN
jgi:hypothetical protein